MINYLIFYLVFSYTYCFGVLLMMWTRRKRLLHTKGYVAAFVLSPLCIIVIFLRGTIEAINEA